MHPPLSTTLEEPDRVFEGPALPAPTDVMPPVLDLSSYRPSPFLRLVQLGFVFLNRMIDSLPGSNWMHRWILNSLELTDVQMPLGRGARGFPVGLQREVGLEGSRVGGVGPDQQPPPVRGELLGQPGQLHHAPVGRRRELAGQGGGGEHGRGQRQREGQGGAMPPDEAATQPDVQQQCS